MDKSKEERPAVDIARDPGCTCCLMIASACILAPIGFVVGRIMSHAWSSAWPYALMIPTVVCVTVWVLVRRIQPDGLRIDLEGIVVRRYGGDAERYPWKEVVEIRNSPVRIILRSGQTVRFTLVAMTEQAREAAHYFSMEADPTPERILRYYLALKEERAPSTRDSVAPPFLYKITALHAEMEQLYGRSLLNTGPQQDMVLQTIIPLPNKAGQCPMEFLDIPSDPDVIAYWLAPCALYFSGAGPLVTLEKEENCPPERLVEVLALVRDFGFDYVPSAICHQMLPDERGDEAWTWFDLFFDYD